MRRLFTLLFSILLFFPFTAAAQAHKKASPTKTPTAVTETQDEKAAIAALRAYHSIRTSATTEQTRQYYLDAKVKVELLPDSALATKIQAAFAPAKSVQEEKQLQAATDA